MKVLITGGAGFVGSHLAEKLVRQNCKVTILDNLSSGNLKNLQLIKNKIKFIRCDLTKQKKLFKLLHNVDYVFHLAGLIDVIKSFDRPIEYYNNNVTGTLNILKAAKKAKVKKFVYAASASCYGNSKKLPTSEKSKIQILSPYALTKWLGELLVMNFSKVHKLSAISLRFFNIYGPRSYNSKSSYSAVINVFMQQKISKKPLTVVGDGKQTRSFIYISDVIDAMIKAAKSNVSGEIFNVGAKKSIRINEIPKLLSSKKIFIPKRIGELKHSKANISKIKKKLNWNPKININVGLKKLMKEF